MKILIPTDYSENALKAFHYAYQLFADRTSEFILLNIQNVRHAGGIITVDINKDLVKQSRKQMDKLVADIHETNPGIRLSGIVTAGTFIDSILEKIDEFSADLVVVGTKGAGGVKNVLLGSNASNLIDHCNKPLVVVPEKAVIQTPRTALLAADFGSNSKPETYDLLLELCYENKAHLNILHVVKPSEEHFREKDIPFNTEGLNYKLEERIDSDVEYAIINFAAENDVNFISIVKSKGGFIHDLFHSSLTKKLGMHIDTPLLVLQPE